ncbi:hypothetical protein [Lactobacillus intestinalis]|uniref:hypothetical protein n=1 Tax=Lactobacillus intestinalis TaxID=151781 RepID=UPI0025A9F8AC|nr:hypothetical protein [Lactobacillus intestinalis]
MKKIKIISLASAAVLAVSPLITTPVNAATNATTTSNSVKNSEIYFTYNGEKIPDNGTVPLKQGLPIRDFLLRKGKPFMKFTKLLRKQ